MKYSLGNEEKKLIVSRIWRDELDKKKKEVREVLNRKKKDNKEKRQKEKGKHGIKRNNESLD